MKEKYERLIEPYIAELMHDLPAVAIDGLKGIGKTVSTKHIANTVYELDRARDFALLKNNLEKLKTNEKPVLIDEWQRMPEVWDYIRRAVDDELVSGSYLLTGSIANTNTDIHSGAGRIIRKKMYPLSLQERNLETPTVSISEIFASDENFVTPIGGETSVEFDQYISEIVMSGLPAFRAQSEKFRSQAFESFFDNILSHEFEQQGVKIRQPQTLLRWLRAYAAATSTNSGYEEILDASTAGEGSKPSAKTTIAYREALGNLWLLDELQAWVSGSEFFTGLKSTPKHYLADPAFAVHLLGLTEEILKSPGSEIPGTDKFNKKYGDILGRLFESLMQLSLRVYSSVNDASLSYAATHKTEHEIDFIVQKGLRFIAFEVKLAPYIEDRDVRHLLWLKEKTGMYLADAIIITTGPFAYRRPDGIAVVPAALLGA
ncbi:MAG: DUF4143 domain-containing protein [Clostridiales Family XIII bacterium]|jgi:predicted AAA+ superfamily ATPase|nr:DUF4143 domain-containing protein [Clostridiales Family XIII bacterium]